MTPLKARQHQGPVQMSGCCDTSQKVAVSQWNPAGQQKKKESEGQERERERDAAGDRYVTVKVQINFCENTLRNPVFNIFFFFF